MGKKLNPLSRATIDKPMDVGVRAINSLLSVGRGQLFAPVVMSGELCVVRGRWRVSGHWFREND